MFSLTFSGFKFTSSESKHVKAQMIVNYVKLLIFSSGFEFQMLRNAILTDK